MNKNGSDSSAGSVKSTSGKSPNKLGSFRGNLGLKFKSKKKSDSESEEAEAGKRKSLKKGGKGEKGLSKGGDEVTSSTEQLEGGKKKGGSLGRKLSFSKLGGKLTGSSKKDSPPKDAVRAPSPPDSVASATTEDDYSDARSNVTLSALSDHSSATSLPRSIEEIETETEFLDAEKSPDFPDSPNISQSSSTLSEQMLQSEARTPTPSSSKTISSDKSSQPKTPTNLKDKILSITTPVTTLKDSSPDNKQEDKSSSLNQNGSKVKHRSICVHALS